MIHIPEFDAMLKAKTFDYHVVKVEVDKDGKLVPISGSILGTDNLAVACGYCYNHWKQFRQPIAVFQPKHNTWREYYVEDNELASA